MICRWHQTKSFSWRIRVLPSKSQDRLSWTWDCTSMTGRKSSRCLSWRWERTSGSCCWSQWRRHSWRRPGSKRAKQLWPSCWGFRPRSSWTFPHLRIRSPRLCNRWLSEWSPFHFDRSHTVAYNPSTRITPKTALPILDPNLVILSRN